jgi:hypothetical protein
MEQQSQRPVNRELKQASEIDGHRVVQISVAQYSNEDTSIGHKLYALTADGRLYWRYHTGTRWQYLDGPVAKKAAPKPRRRDICPCIKDYGYTGLNVLGHACGGEDDPERLCR